jgi:hypothetical protein
MELVVNQFQGGHAIMEAQSAPAGKYANVNLAWKLLHGRILLAFGAKAGRWSTHHGSVVE